MNIWRSIFLGVLLPIPALAQVPVDRLDFTPDLQVGVEVEGESLTLSWPMGDGNLGQMLLNLKPGQPLIQRLAVVEEGTTKVLLKEVDPAFLVTTGIRQSPPDRPESMSVFNVFFDSPADRPHKTDRAKLDLKKVRVTGKGGRASIKLSTISAGSFSGDLVLSVYSGSRLVQVEAQMATNVDNVAYFYDAGLISEKPTWTKVAWYDTEGQLQRSAAIDAPAEPEAVRYRTIVAESNSGSVALFPPPHRFFSPRDYTDNLKTTWHGRDYDLLKGFVGLGIRQAKTGGGRFSPWYNARNGLRQPMTLFLLLTTQNAAQAVAESQRYTHGDRFPNLPGHITFTSHWHMAIADAAMKELAKGGPRSMPDFVKMFKDMNAQSVHLAEFHGDGHPQDPGPLRLPELEAMHDECKRLSDNNLLFMPGEEANVYLQNDHRQKNEPAGHWLYFFPKPVYWIMKRTSDEPFVEAHPKYGKVYRVGSKADMINLLIAEGGLAWTAHARIKSSNWTPDAYKSEDFFKASFWLGAAWKAMPADPGYDKLGDRVLGLFDDMNNWGAHKQVLGEVDVFKLDHTHELYGHMNVNYLRLSSVPKFEDGWKPILDALRGGEFFVTTGEVLIRDFTVDGNQSGATIKRGKRPENQIHISLDWTFPMNYVEVISGDGQAVYRDRIKLLKTGAFVQESKTISLNLAGRTWVRVEAWDIAGNGAFSQPVWIEP